MMEVPVLKTWIHSVFMDALETALVDPGRFHINLFGNKVTSGFNNWVASAQGVLSIIISTSQIGKKKKKSKILKLRKFWILYTF